MTILFILPFSECQDFIWANNYWFIAYKFYVILYLGRCLTTIHAVIGLTVVWNQYRNLQKYQVTCRCYYLLVFIVSFMLYLPIIFLYKISGTKSQTLYTLDVVNVDYLKIYNACLCAFSFCILFLTLVLNSIISFNLRKQKKSKRESIIMKEKRNSKRVSILSSLYDNKNNMLMCYSTSSKSLSKNSSPSIRHVRKNSQFCSTKTKLTTIYITMVFSIDQFLKTMLAYFELYAKPKSIEAYFILIICFTLLILSQLSHILIYYKFNKTFSKSLKHYFYIC